MADSSSVPPRRNLFSRFGVPFGKLWSSGETSAPASVAVVAAPSNGNGNGRHHFLAGTSPIHEKSALSLLPQLNGIDPDFFGRTAKDGTVNFVELGGAPGLALVAYWYVARRWRAQKIAEAPLMVVEEDQEDSSEEWLSDHELAGVLDSPSPDYDMGELLERTSHYLDDGAECLWVLDRDRGQRIARITPFARGQFSAERADGRLYGRFRVQTAEGPRVKAPEEVCYFRDAADGWTGGRSRLDVAMAWLRLGETARQTIRDLLNNSVWPSLVAIPDKDWNPDKDALEQYKQELNSYGQPGQKGRAFAALGGGTVLQLVARIRDLVPEELLNRVESIVAAVSGVPAIVLQFQIGMENSPWSQMGEARRMAYEDTVQPAWRRLERTMTRQMLRTVDEDTTHFIRFDTSTIAALQPDRQQAATIASMMGRAATLNERRKVMALEPSDDPRADEIPELSAPLTNPFAPTNDAANADANTKAAKALKRRRGVLAISAALTEEIRGQWESHAARLLRQDKTAIERIVRAKISGRKSRVGVSRKDESAPDLQRLLRDVMVDVEAYLRDSEKQWGQVAVQLNTHGAERSAAVTAADLGIGFNQLHPHVVAFAKREAAKLVTGILETTRKAVADAIVAGLEAVESAEQIARRVADAGVFAPSRAQLIAQTEATKASAGGPTEALQALARDTGRTFTKTWHGKLDTRERPEHVALEGEVRFIDDVFSNGLQFPSEPNCRCELILNEVSDA